MWKLNKVLFVKFQEVCITWLEMHSQSELSSTHLLCLNEFTCLENPTVNTSLVVH